MLVFRSVSVCMSVSGHECVHACMPVGLALTVCLALPLPQSLPTPVAAAVPRGLVGAASLAAILCYIACFALGAGPIPFLCACGAGRAAAKGDEVLLRLLPAGGTLQLLQPPLRSVPDVKLASHCSALPLQTSQKCCPRKSWASRRWVCVCTGEGRGGACSVALTPPT